MSTILHILSAVEKLCDRTGILVEGRLMFPGGVENFNMRWCVEKMEEGFKMRSAGKGLN